MWHCDDITGTRCAMALLVLALVKLAGSACPVGELELDSLSGPFPDPVPCAAFSHFQSSEAVLPVLRAHRRVTL